MERVLLLAIGSAILLTTYGHLSGAGEPACLPRYDHDMKVLQSLAELGQSQKSLAASGMKMSKRQDSLDERIEELRTNNRCPDAWTRYAGSCYLFVDDHELSWDQAAGFCEIYGESYLASIDTFKEQTFLRNSVKKLKNAAGSHKRFWVGARDTREDNTWVWVGSGKLVSDTEAAWNPGQPGDKAQHCALLWGDTDFTLHDWLCGRTGYFICEKHVGRMDE